MAADGEGVEEGVSLRAGGPEAIAAAELVGVALLGDERGEVGVVFDALVALVAARVAGDLGYCSSVAVMNALYGSSALGRTCVPGRMKRSLSTARRTVS